MLTYYHILSTSIHSTTTAAHRGCKSKWLRTCLESLSRRLESWAPCTLELTILFIYMTSCIALSSTLVGYCYQLYRLEGQSQGLVGTYDLFTCTIDGVNKILVKNLECCFLRQINWRSTSIRGRTSAQIKTWGRISRFLALSFIIVRIGPKMMKESDF